MATRYPVQIRGFENQKIELESAGLFSPSKLLINGIRAETGQKNNEAIIRKSDGSKTSVFFQNAFFDTIPRLVVNGEIIRIVPPLQWYQYVYCGLTLFLIFFGGAIGAVISMIGFLMNIRTMRSQNKVWLKYLIILGTHVAVMILYVAISLFIQVMTNSVVN